MKPVVFHIGQFDGFWSLTFAQMKEFLETKSQCVEDYDETYTRIKKPRHVYRNRDIGGYWSMRNNYYDMPCDWDDEEWADKLADFRSEYGKHLA